MTKPLLQVSGLNSYYGASHVGKSGRTRRRMFRLVGWLVDWLVGMLVGCFFEVIGLSIGVDLRFYVHIYGTVL